MMNSFNTTVLLMWVTLLSVWAQDRPNIVIFQADQYRRQAMGFWSKPEYAQHLQGKGDPVHTPNLDALADESVVFTRGTPIHPVCSPARGMLMTGLLPVKNGLTENSSSSKEIRLKTEVKTITDILSGEGYNTAMIGKAHWIKPEQHFDGNGNYVGEGGTSVLHNYDTYVPPGEDRHSTEYWFQMVKHDTHTNPYGYSSDPAANGGKKDGDASDPQEFSTKLESEVIADYINNTRGQRDEDKPFVLIWNTVPPHSPYKADRDVEMDVYNQYYAGKPLSELLVRDNVQGTKANVAVAYYFSMVTSVDKYLGDVLKAIDDKGIKDNTIFLFTADHGEMMGSHDDMAKNLVWEESHGVPYVLRYPKVLEPRVDDLLIGHIDIVPTVLGLAGINIPIISEMDGTNYAQNIIDPDYTGRVRPKSSLYIGGKTRGLVTEKYSIEFDETGSVVKLYNNLEDPYQLNSLSYNSLSTEEQEMIADHLGNWLVMAEDDWAANNTASNVINYPATVQTQDVLQSAIKLSHQKLENQSVQINVDFDLAGDVNIIQSDVAGKTKVLKSGFQNAGELNVTASAFSGPGVYFIQVTQGKKVLKPLSVVIN